MNELDIEIENSRWLDEELNFDFMGSAKKRLDIKKKSTKREASLNGTPLSHRAKITSKLNRADDSKLEKSVKGQQKSKFER